jgi:hypothetical protein
MTRVEAAEKVAKLRRLASGTPNEHEASSARAQAERLIAEHFLTEDDLTSGEKAAAFDDLVDALHRYTVDHPALHGGMFGSSTILEDILHKVKNLKKPDKTVYLGKIATYIRTATFLAGDHVPSLREIKRILDDTLHSHQIKL